MITAQPLPFKEVEGKTELVGPVFLSCGCAGPVARWASISQYLATRIPHAKPKSSRMISDWLTESGLREKFPALKQHQYGLCVAPVEGGYDGIDIMVGTTTGVAQRIAELIERSKQCQNKQNKTSTLPKKS